MVTGGDLEHKAREAARLPSVEDWVAAGGVVEVLTAPPREAAMIGPMGGMTRQERKG